MTDLKTQCKQLFSHVNTHHPEGIAGKQYVPITLNDRTLELRCFTHRGNGDDVECCLFIPNQRYARCSFIAYQDGRFQWDNNGIIPASDLTDNEPVLPTDALTLVTACLDTLQA